VQYSAAMATIELWLFTVTDPLTGKRRRTTYRLTLEDARERYIDPQPVPGSLERLDVTSSTFAWGRRSVRSRAALVPDRLRQMIAVTRSNSGRRAGSVSPSHLERIVNFRKPNVV
jgi:hypothetical protein